MFIFTVNFKIALNCRSLSGIILRNTEKIGSLRLKIRVKKLKITSICSSLIYSYSYYIHLNWLGHYKMAINKEKKVIFFITCSYLVNSVNKPRIQICWFL